MKPHMRQEAAFVSVVSTSFFSVVFVADTKEALYYEAPLTRKIRLNSPIPFFGFTGASGQG